ncbi:MAG: GNAT family N-acetyltransferase [Desulfobacterales bacterium]|nr:GNAT family N-acetyltransferase [Desulfobacterales bacterium]
MTEITIRNTAPEDHEKVINVMPEWWNGRDLTSAVHKIFFIHFCNTSFIAERDDKLIGFLVAFFSQTDNDLGYIHFAGVHPEYRKDGIGRRLYASFFDLCRVNGRSVVKCCTSPVNKLSIAFHRHMGFDLEAGDDFVDGFPVTVGFLGKKEPMVLFRKEVEK